MDRPSRGQGYEDSRTRIMRKLTSLFVGLLISASAYGEWTCERAAGCQTFPEAKTQEEYCPTCVFRPKQEPNVTNVYNQYDFHSHTYVTKPVEVRVIEVRTEVMVTPRSYPQIFLNNPKVYIKSWRPDGPNWVATVKSGNQTCDLYPVDESISGGNSSCNGNQFEYTLLW